MTAELDIPLTKCFALSTTLRWLRASSLYESLQDLTRLNFSSIVCISSQFPSPPANPLPNPEGRVQRRCPYPVTLASRESFFSGSLPPRTSNSLHKLAALFLSSSITPSASPKSPSLFYPTMCLPYLSWLPSGLSWILSPFFTVKIKPPSWAYLPPDYVSQGPSLFFLCLQLRRVFFPFFSSSICKET